MKVRSGIILLILLIGSQVAWTQGYSGITDDPQHPVFANPSFEGIATSSNPPPDWRNCGFPEESPPDVQPSGAWEVFRPAFHGYTYLGMVTRENDTWESVGQKLNYPLLAGHCYEFSIYLCSSSEYWSAVAPDTAKDRQFDPSQLPKKNFNQAIKLRIWGGDGYCDKKQLLAESETISGTNWKKYSWKMEPQKDVTHVMLEAFYKTPTLFPYNGNILVDHASAFTMVACEEGEELIFEPSVRILQPIEKINPRLNQVRINAVVRNIKTKSQIKFKVNSVYIDVFDFNPSDNTFSTVLYLTEGKNNIHLSAKNEAGMSEDETQVYIIEKGKKVEEQAPPEKPEDAVVASPKKDYKVLKDLNKDAVKEGEIIEIERLYFPADSSNLRDPASFAVLGEIVQYLKEHPKVSIEVRGHTSVVYGMKEHYSLDLSQARAKTVADYLVSEGVDSTRIKYKGYGFKHPIATNETKEGKRKNQRVEIKILTT